MTQPRTDESRRYRILDVLGEGGFGKVYRARLEGAEGFAKDVAIKLLTDSEAPDEVLQRFRDESRILGLIRDRAIVTVDPPTRLDGRWAVVMEFVDGTNCERVLQSEPVPPRPAVEIVQEVARALDNVYNQKGPNGEALQLIHRDIKPGNIQISPAGTIKILDFGIARARFASRESKTTTHIGGTFGYIAPERLEGEEGAAGDVYSLGVVLAALICGRRPTGKTRVLMKEWVAKDPDLQKVWDLAQEMQSADPTDRPTAREVEDRCAEMSATLRGGPLRRWAERTVPAVVEQGSTDRLVGSVLTETMAYLPRFDTEAADIVDPPRSSSVRPWLLAVSASVVFCAIFAFVLTGLMGTSVTLGFLAGMTGQSTSATPSTAVEPVPTTIQAEDPEPEPSNDASPDGASTDEDGTADGDAEAGEDGEHGEDSEADASEEPPVEPAPTPRPRPRPRPRPSARTVSMTFGSVPIGAKLFVDGRYIGTTPVVGHDLPHGDHEIQMWQGEDKIVRAIHVGRRDPVRYIWEGGEEWRSFY